MIKVIRKSAPPSAWLQDGKNERNKAVRHYYNSKTKKPRRPKKQFDNYKVYRNPGVKELISSAFNGKCAYCQSDINHTQPGDVEHYRPKGRIVTNDGKVLTPGYYWLASDWDNLLFACVFCNRLNKYLVAGETVKKTYGKHDHFPLDNETRRCEHYGQRLLKEEKLRLILHPYFDNPEKHLSFSNDGNISAGIYRKKPSDKGAKTILICGLHRMSLVHKRAAFYKRILREFLTIDLHRKSIKNLTSKRITLKSREVIRDLKNDIDARVNHLLDLTKPGNQYSAFAKQMLVLEFSKRRMGPR